jgi:lon-related putative ATP-dependent protease
MSQNNNRLAPAALVAPFAEGQFDFETTADLSHGTALVGQERALASIELALGMDNTGYNLFAAGPQGTGRHALVQRMLGEQAARKEAQQDWLYVRNFVEERLPKAIGVPAGVGKPFKQAVDKLIGDLRNGLTSAFSSEDYRDNAQRIQEEYQGQQEEDVRQLREEAMAAGLALLHTPVGYSFAPILDGKVMPPEVFAQLDKEQRRKIEADVDIFQDRLKEDLQKIPGRLQLMQEDLEKLNEETANYAIGDLIAEIKRAFSKVDTLTEYLNDFEQDVVSNVEPFLGGGQNDAGPFVMPGSSGRDNYFRRYRVNLIVDNSDGDGAPVIYEDEPSYERLIGRIEHRAEMGALVTDFNMIQPGALHAANGGYLILDVRKVLQQPLAWEGLKRALSSQEIRIETMYGAMGLPSTTALQPQSIPLSVKVVLVGEGQLYYLLHQFDPDFRNQFKVLADFDEAVPNDDHHAQGIAQMAATVCAQESLMAFDRQGVVALANHAARLAGDRERLSTNIDALTDLMREADHLARQEGRDIVGGPDVGAALDAQRRRSSRLSERMQEQITRGTVLIDTTGEQVGQLNGLSVYMLGGQSFGKPSRITAVVRLGQGKVVDIEREVDLGGALHSKGVLILSGYLGANYVPQTPLSLSASLVFEQSYGGLDGDSASSAELYTLLSAIADIPLKQHFAVTGSVNQLGEVQAIGGANEKIEGFFDLCHSRGLTGDQGVLIPASNVKHLVLHDRVIDAVQAGKFHIYPVSHINEGLAILSGLDAGIRGDDGQFPAGSFNARVEERLLEFADSRRKFARKSDDKDDDENGK